MKLHVKYGILVLLLFEKYLLIIIIIDLKIKFYNNNIILNEINYNQLWLNVDIFKI